MVHIHLHLSSILSEGQAGEACEPSNKSSALPDIGHKIAVTLGTDVASNYTPEH